MSVVIFESVCVRDMLVLVSDLLAVWVSDLLLAVWVRNMLGETVWVRKLLLLAVWVGDMLRECICPLIGSTFAYAASPVF